MAIDTEINHRYTSGADAKANAKNAKAAQAAGNPTTARGTLIKKSNGEVDKNSFLKILAAQLSNLDPTQNQDSSAYVSQMAQFASMEQMTNLNNTMSDYAHQEMIGKTVILDEKYEDGSYVKGDVTQVIKKSGVTYYTVLIDGKKEEIDAKNIIGTAPAIDNNMIANSRTALNSDFIAASALANKNKNVIVTDLDKDKKLITIKGKVSGAYIDTLDGAVVKVKVDVVDADGKSTTKTYKYQDIISAGDITEDDMNATVKAVEAALKAEAEAEAKAKAEAEAAEAKAKAEAEAAKAKAEAGV